MSMKIKMNGGDVDHRSRRRSSGARGDVELCEDSWSQVPTKSLPSPSQQLTPVTAPPSEDSIPSSFPKSTVKVAGPTKAFSMKLGSSDSNKGNDKNKKLSFAIGSSTLGQNRAHKRIKLSQVVATLETPSQSPVKKRETANPLASPEIPVSEPKTPISAVALEGSISHPFSDKNDSTELSFDNAVKPTISTPSRRRQSHSDVSPKSVPSQAKDRRTSPSPIKAKASPIKINSHKTSTTRQTSRRRERSRSRSRSSHSGYDSSDSQPRSRKYERSGKSRRAPSIQKRRHSSDSRSSSSNDNPEDIPHTSSRHQENRRPVSRSRESKTRESTFGYRSDIDDRLPSRRYSDLRLQDRNSRYNRDHDRDNQRRQSRGSNDSRRESTLHSSRRGHSERSARPDGRSLSPGARGISIKQSGDLESATAVPADADTHRDADVYDSSKKAHPEPTLLSGSSERTEAKPHVTVKSAEAVPTKPLKVKRPPRSTPIKLERFKIYRSIEAHFEDMEQIGQGTFGTVYKAHLKSCSKIVALKQIVDKKGKNNIFTVPNMREFRFLMKYRHKNLLECIGMVSYDRPQAFGPEVHEYMVLEYMDHDLAGLMQHYPDKSLYQVEHIKCIAKQMLEGMEYMHSMGVMHRDLKVGNLLLNNKGELKIADFGFAREKEVYEERGYTNRVCTIWYRPLEVLLGQLHYSYEIDMWGAGCIIAEMFLKYPIFHTSRGRDTEQIKRIFSICGHPTDEDWDMYRHMDHSWSKMWLRPKQKFARRLESYLTEKAVTPMTPMAIDLISKLLSYNPNARPTVKEALQHPFFTEELPAACLPEELPAIDGSWHEYECKERIKQQKSGRKGDTNYLQSGAKAKAAVADPAPAAPEQEEAPAAAENEIDGRCVWDEARETWWDSITESLWDVDRWVPLQEYDRRRYLTDVSHKSSSQQEDPYRGREFDRDARVDSRDPHRHGAGAHHREVAPTSNTPYRSYERSHHPTGSYVDQSRGYGTEPRRGHFSYGQHGMPGNERTPYRGDQGRGRYGYDHSAPRSSGYSRHANYHDYPLSPTRDNRQGDRPPTIDTRTIDARSGDRPPSSGHYRESGHSQEQTGWDDGWGRGSARPGGTIKRSRESSADMYSIPDPRSAPGSHSRESKTPLQHSPTSAERNNNGFRGSDYSIPIHRANSRDLSSAPIHDDRTARRPDEFQHRSRPHSLDQRLGISERHQSFSGYENRVERHRSRSGDRDGRDKQESPTRRISPRKLFSRSRSRSPVRRTSGNVSRSRSRSQSKSRSSRSVDHSQSRGSESPSSRRDSRSSQGSSASKESPGGSPPNPPSEPSKSPSKRPREDEVEESNGRHEAKRHRSETATSSPSKRPIITPKNGGTSLDHEIATSAPPVGGSHADNQFADSPQRDSQRGQSIPSQEIVGKLNQEEPVTGHATHSTTLDDTLQHLPTEEPPIHHDESGLDDKPVVLKTFGSDSNAEIWALGKGFYASTHQYTQRLSELAKEEHRQEQRLTGSNSLSEPRQVARFCPDQHRLLDPILDIPWIEQQQLISRSV